MFNIRNPILKAALEELSAQSEEGAPEEVVTTTDVVEEDAVAQLQSRLEVLETENYESEAANIQANGEEVQRDLDEAIGAAAALEAFGAMAILSSSTGTATKVSNAGLAMAIEEICTRVGVPSVVAAMEADTPLLSGRQAQQDAAKGLGERAKETAAKIIERVIAFIKRISAWFGQFIEKILGVFADVGKQAKALHDQLAPLKDGVEISDEVFIKSLRLVSDDADQDFRDYAVFATKTYAALNSAQLFDGAKKILVISPDKEGDEQTGTATSAVMRALTTGIFTAASEVHSKDGASIESGGYRNHASTPRFLGGLCLSLQWGPTNDTGRFVQIKNVGTVETKAPTTIKGPVTAKAREMLNLIVKWSDDVAALKTRVSELDKLANSKPTNEGARLFMSCVSQLTTVLAPSVARHNLQISRQYVGYVKRALTASKSAEQSPATA